jgi:hypothetical protein
LLVRISTIKWIVVGVKRVLLESLLLLAFTHLIIKKSLKVLGVTISNVCRHMLVIAFSVNNTYFSFFIKGH